MKKSRKLISALLVAALSLSLVTACQPGDSGSKTDTKASETKAGETSTETKAPGGDGGSAVKDGGKVLNIYCWNTEFKERFEAYAKDVVPADVEVVWNITPNAQNAYQNKLDGELMNQEYLSDDERIDIFLVEADYALKYVNKGVTLDVKDLGLTDEDLSQMYPYTKEIMTDSQGKIKGVSWQATPGLFVYRRSFAKEILGTDDPAEVQKAIADWTKFDETAEKAKAKGYTMLAGYDDAYRTFSNNVTKKWVDDNKNIVIDDNLKKWVEQTKEYTDKGYNKKTSLWNDDWAAEQGKAGKTFGFFYSTWGINFTLEGNSLEDKNGEKKVGNGIYGDWAATYGPQSYFWGGTWICASSKTDNKTVIADIMKKLTVDADTMKKITQDTQDYTNNIKAMEEIANSDFKSDFLGGQNHIALFAEAAKKIKMDMTTPYDQGLNESFQQAMRDYFNPDEKNVDTYDKALQNFYDLAVAKYPDLKKPA